MSSVDYTAIYKRGVSSGMEKGKQLERESIKNAFNDIVKADSAPEAKFDKIAELFQIDKEVIQNGFIRNSEIGDHEQDKGNE